MNSSAPGPDGAPAPDPSADPRPVYERAARQMAFLFDSVRPAQLADPTPCPDFSVGALLSHVVGGTLRIAQVGEGGGPGEVDPDAEVDSGVSGVADDAWPAAYAEARERFSAAWADDAKLDAVVTVPWGTMPGRFALAGSVMEVVTHAWDLAQALGRRTELDNGLAEFALAVAKQAAPAERRGGDVPFGPAVPPPEGADAYDELAAWLGRSWTPAGSADGSHG
ncbi:TIGR03086 family metal-binding protein [Streptomyces ovatisporus]|uniref:TIGR03086 family metal-binding protein n=1 Tax=Streptomyces ovatisporus TaxID=1128682 RepID=A0ABV9A914_9ACTN